MKGIVKALIIGGVIIGVGIIILIIALSLNGWNLKGKIDFEMTTYECENASISALDVDINAGTVKTEFYYGDKIIIEYPEADGFKTTINVVNDTLIFKAPRKVWYRNWFLSFDIPDTVIRIPESFAPMNVKFDIDAGSAYLADGAYSRVAIDIDAGSFKGGDITCQSVNVNIDAGSVSVNSAQCQFFDCEVDAGSVSVNKLTADSTNLDVDAGSVTISFAGVEEDYTITKRVRAGSCNLNSRTNPDPNAKKINVDVSAGKVTASFVG
ncbi:MAG: DUF4097 domain-containing protein [Clostridia bacterium]|nr:DUF4097 domain-containing protein [Clostridia bacterium]